MAPPPRHAPPRSADAMSLLILLAAFGLLYAWSTGRLKGFTYEDGIAAMEWLAEVFGFKETTRFTTSDGRLSHGEMSIGDGLIMLASPSPDYEGPKRHRGNCEIAASWSALPWIIDGVLVYVEDVDEHYAQAKAAGAVILSEPEDGPPARRYRVEDLEGHRWMFMARN